DYADRAVDFSKRVKDVTEFLVDLGPVIGGPVDATATYDAPCHLHHAQRVQDAPLSLLGSIPELDLRPLRRSEVCCGAGGTYNLTQPELASDILGEKLENIRDTGADVVVTGNPGCHMQILAGVRLEGLELEVRHPVELLDASYEAAGMYGSETS
ncbi:MAG: (Fe-S)-binding protein, partial [Candidatus Latescibacteria bacterium]|nr:(Fe-S)-binding protein [Candidatus Latescibacterota bacterium]